MTPSERLQKLLNNTNTEVRSFDAEGQAQPVSQGVAHKWLKAIAPAVAGTALLAGSAIPNDAQAQSLSSFLPKAEQIGGLNRIDVATLKDVERQLKQAGYKLDVGVGFGKPGLSDRQALHEKGVPASIGAKIDRITQKMQSNGISVTFNILQENPMKSHSARLGDMASQGQLAKLSTEINRIEIHKSSIARYSLGQNSDQDTSVRLR